jgi:iron complex outermembrane receptor protein
LAFCIPHLPPAGAMGKPPDTLFNIPAQALSNALIAFGEQANVHVLMSGRAADALRSHAVAGPLAAESALRQLLDGTGMTYAFADDHTVIVKPIPSSNSVPRADAAAIMLLPPIQAIGLEGRDESFMADVSSGSERTISDPLDVPQSVGVVTQGLLQSAQMQTVAEAVQNIAGVQYAEGASGHVFDIRGFIAGKGMTDDMPNNILGIGDLPPIVGVERIEVLKGPESVLGDTSAYNNFGGLINVVLKKPQPESVHQISFAIGERGERQLGLDLAGALHASRRLSYRLVANGDISARTPQGMHGQRNGYVAPSIAWSTPRTTFITGLSWMMDRVPVPDHTLLLGTTPGSSSPLGLVLDHPGDGTTMETRRIYYMFDHRFDSVFTFRSRAQYVRESIDAKFWSMNNIDPSGDVTAIAQAYRSEDAFYVLQNDLTASWGNGWMQHAMGLGFDYSQFRLGRSYYAINNDGNGMPYNIFTGSPLMPAGSTLSGGDYAAGFLPASPWTTETGVFLRDRLSFGVRWDVLIAWRRTGYELQTFGINGVPVTRHRAQWVPHYGIVYRLSPDISIYANRSSGFQPDTSLGKNNRPLSPALSRQIEVGAKFNLFKNHARLTIAAYRIALNHSADLLMQRPLQYYFVPGPGQSNKGLEMEFNGRAAPGWDISAALTRAAIHNDDGSLPLGASRLRFNIWTRYAFQYGRLRGFGLAVGLQARSRSLAQLSDGSAYIGIPGQVGMSATMFYRLSHWNLALGVKNLLSHTLYGAQFDETFVPVQNHRRYMLSGTFDF